MMNISIVLIAVLVLFDGSRDSRNEANEYTLAEAIQKDVIRAEFQGNETSTHYLKPIVTNLENNTNINIVIRISAGYRLSSVDSNIQDVILTNEEMIALKPYEKLNLPLSGMCIQHHNSAPTASSTFTFNGFAAPKLRTWAEVISTNKWQNIQGQWAMWSLSDGEDEMEIMQYGTEEDWQIFSAFLIAQGRNIPDKRQVFTQVAEKRKMKAELNGVFKMSFSRQVPVHIALFTEDGIVLKEVLKKTLPKGKHEVTYTFDAFPYQGQTIYARLIAFDDVLLNRQIDL
jgi:hypothetical protein